MAVYEDIQNVCPRSLLDTDLYKLTMQQAVLQHFPKANVTYRFTNRSEGMLFSRECFELVKRSITRLSDLRLTSQEAEWLRSNCTYFTEEYLDYLRSYRFRPHEQVKLEFQITSEQGAMEEGNITLEIKGIWVETILYEVPVMSILSEAYFVTVDKGWTHVEQEELGYEKARRLIQAGISFSDLGTRRRRSYRGQDLTLQGLIRGNQEYSKACQGRFASTSNPHFAMKYGLAAMGIMAHEWIMGIAAIHGYENANNLGMDLWEATYPTTKSNVLHIALTDTFSTDAFKLSFKTDRARAVRWRGLRQDSGDPFEFIPKVHAAYNEMGIDHQDKVLVFSDSLDVELAIKIKRVIDRIGFNGEFGIGTFFTNDYKRTDTQAVQRSAPLIMVIKLASVEGKPCVKISDDMTKNTGDSELVTEIKRRLGILI